MVVARGYKPLKPLQVNSLIVSHIYMKFTIPFVCFFMQELPASKVRGQPEPQPEMYTYRLIKYNYIIQLIIIILLVHRSMSVIKEGESWW